VRKKNITPYRNTLNLMLYFKTLYYYVLQYVGDTDQQDTLYFIYL